jgi:multidrug efflux system membrane fusion protein
MQIVRSLAAIVSIAMMTACSSTPQADTGGMALPPTPVSIGQAVEETVPIQVRVVGTVEPYSSVEVKSLVPGALLSVRFAEGAIVQKGDLLFEIDPRPFREALRQAEAALKKDEAELRVAEANLGRSRAQLKNAQADAARFELLSKEGISTRMQDEQIRTAAEVAAQAVRGDEAAIESIRASLESDRAAIDQAKLNMSYTQIRSPLTGRAGNLLLHPGNLVQANGEEPLVVINQITPIFVTFGVPERYLSDISQRNSQRKLTVEVSPERDGRELLRGTLSVIDNTVDPNTGTIRLKATLENREGRLWPGQFVNAALTIEMRTATLIPAEAVQAGQQGPFVYVVKADQTAEPRPVVVGQNVGGRLIVEQGVTAGESVVTDGQSRLFPGAKVAVAAPAADPKVE